MDLPNVTKVCLGAVILLAFSAQISGAQSADRIVTFHSEISVARDRTLTVTEKFEFVNDAGSFTDGFHRRLWIKAAGPHRAKAGGFQSITARVDGSDGIIQTSGTSIVYDIQVSPQSNHWSPGTHSIELHYTAKHQFLIYDDFEHFNQDISGEWPVPIEKADVELMFPAGFPNDASISAATGADSDFQFDCVRKVLPSGVNFEATHPIEPGKELFISARFSQRGYFVSNFREDGLRALIENHPLLFPWLAFLSGVIVFVTLGFVTAQPAHKVLCTSPGVPTDHQIAVVVSAAATALSMGSLFVFHEPYTAMPGFMLGALVSIGISGSPHGGEPFSLVIIGTLEAVA
ncbi:MAG: DUF2207 domain-containing protein [Candidatus Acidiferrum sp.]